MHHILKSFSKEIEKNSGYLNAVKQPLGTRIKKATKGFGSAMMTTGVAGTGLLGYGAIKYRPMV